MKNLAELGSVTRSLLLFFSLALSAFPPQWILSFCVGLCQNWLRVSFLLVQSFWCLCAGCSVAGSVALWLLLIGTVTGSLFFSLSESFIVFQFSSASHVVSVWPLSSSSLQCNVVFVPPLPLHVHITVYCSISSSSDWFASRPWPLTLTTVDTWPQFPNVALKGVSHRFYTSSSILMLMLSTL